jgi:TRAP-type C4-dicarboxylate transport system permease small subunit
MDTAAQFIRAAVGWIDEIIGVAESWALAALMAAVTIVVFMQVMFRFVFNDPLIWTDESSRYLLIWISLVGAAAAVRLGGHYGMMILIERLSPYQHRLAVMFGTLVIAGFAAIVLVYGVFDTLNAARQRSITLPISMHWAYLAIPVGAGLTLWHLFARLICQGPWAEHTRSHTQPHEHEPST